jgi:hypothetical protein
VTLRTAFLAAARVFAVFATTLRLTALTADFALRRTAGRERFFAFLRATGRRFGARFFAGAADFGAGSDFWSDF